MAIGTTPIRSATETGSPRISHPNNKPSGGVRKRRDDAAEALVRVTRNSQREYEPTAVMKTM